VHPSPSLLKNIYKTLQLLNHNSALTHFKAQC